MMSKGEEAILGVVPREVTIFFSDIAGFTTICEKMRPNELLTLLSDYFAAMCALIIESRGTMLEFIGDAILAVWNAPQDVPDHAYQCVDQSVSMHAYLDDMAPTWKEKGYPEINIRCGIHTATVFVGNIGSPDRMKYGVLGDGVNLASRLEELNKRYKTRTMVSINTFNKELVQKNFLIRPLDLVAVKGKSKGTGVYEVFGRKADADPREITLCETQMKAFDAYYKQEWDTAIATFADVNSQFTALYGYADAASELLKSRCEELKQDPPGADWDGCEVLKKKHF